jgi:NTP pyrophosphatase (non-canonical NTP hydrolase)
VDIRNAQERMASFFKERGWDYSVNDTLLHLMEEVGELTWLARRPEQSTREKVEDEIADVLSLVLQAANGLSVDAERAWIRKLEKSESRFPIKSPAQ